VNRCSFLNRLCRYQIPRFATISLLMLAWSIPAFFVEIHEASGVGDLETVKVLLIDNPDGVTMNEHKYFPDSAFDSKNRPNIFRTSWYTKNLVALKETSLFELSGDKSANCYRFLWLRSFHEPVSIRLNINSEGLGQLFLKITNGHGGHDPGSLITDKTSAISKHQVDKFLNMLEKASSFWQQPTEEKSDRVVLDGARWIMEGIKNGQYHIVDRWSPSKGNYRETALFLMKLADIKIEKENIY
jgi:hypothetical protein